MMIILDLCFEFLKIDTQVKVFLVLKSDSLMRFDCFDRLEFRILRSYHEDLSGLKIMFEQC